MTEPDQTRWRDRLESIAAFGRAMNAAHSAVDVAEFVAEEIRVAVDASAVSISRWEPSRGVLRTLVNVGELAGWEERRPPDETHEVDEYAILVDVTAAGKAAVFYVGDPDCPPSERANLEGLGKHSSLVAAIQYGGRVWGELYLTRSADKPPFSRADLEFADGIAGFVAMAFAQGDRLDAVSAVAFRDPLTRLANRGAMDEALEEAFERRRRHGGEVGLVLADVNGLKSVNDVSGHGAGDRLLVVAAGVMRLAAERAGDGLAARLGGDEFGILLRNATSEATLRVGEYLCAEMRRVTPYGVACGIACTAEASLRAVDTPRRLLRIADAAQYRAKRAGLSGPEVAGREAAAPMAVRSVGRRTYRVGGNNVLAGLLDAGLKALDDVSGEEVRRRLRALAESVSQALNAAAWFVSVVEPGGQVLRALEGESYRPSDTAPIWDLDQLTSEQWALEDHPQTAAALAGGGFAVGRGDPDSDPAEQAVLGDSGYDAVVAAGGTDQDGTGWLLEVYADDLSGDVTGLAGLLRVLVACAVAPPGTGRDPVRAISGDVAW